MRGEPEMKVCPPLVCGRCSVPKRPLAENAGAGRMKADEGRPAVEAAEQGAWVRYVRMPRGRFAMERGF